MNHLFLSIQTTQTMLNQKKNKVSEKDFLESLKDWATSIMSGDLSARIEILKNSHNKDIAENLNAVTDMFEAQLIKNNEQLERFTEYEKEKNKILIIEERFKIASELHDSLAQTLASLKIQARVLDESIHQGDDSQMWNELEKLEDSIHKANAEIRELIKQFRTGPKATKNFITELENLIDSFKKENSSIKIFLQIEDKKVNLSDDQSRNTLKIIQEAITNVLKHSQAKIVRLFVSKEKDNTVNVLVEDDGIGIAKSCFIGHEEEVSGEHFGISVMKDRANQMNARLDIESEPGEGVRIKLNIPLN
jgi:two-component system nitrate/nitrite sensor histidine kinase NarX